MSTTIETNRGVLSSAGISDINFELHMLLEERPKIVRVCGHLDPEIDPGLLQDLLRLAHGVEVCGDSSFDDVLFDAIGHTCCDIVDVDIPLRDVTDNIHTYKLAVRANKSLRCVAVSSATAAAVMSVSTTVERFRVVASDKLRVDWLPILQMPSVRRIDFVLSDAPPMDLVGREWKNFSVTRQADGSGSLTRVDVWEYYSPSGPFI